MSSPLPTLSICLSYVYIVKVLGPKLMENRKPFELRRVLIAYNAFQVVFSTWLFYEVCSPPNLPSRPLLLSHFSPKLKLGLRASLSYH